MDYAIEASGVGKKVKGGFRLFTGWVLFTRLNIWTQWLSARDIPVEYSCSLLGSTSSGPVELGAPLRISPLSRGLSNELPLVDARDRILFTLAGAEIGPRSRRNWSTWRPRVAPLLPRWIVRWLPASVHTAAWAIDSSLFSFIHIIISIHLKLDPLWIIC